MKRREGTEMNSIAILPVTYTHRAYLDREALRIAAGVKGATFKAVAWNLYWMARNSGAAEDAAQLEVARAIEWIEARLEQINDLRASPPPTGGRGTCARG